NNAIRFDRIRVGDLLWRTHDPDLARAAKPFLDPPSPVARQHVDVHVVAREGEPLIAQWKLKDFSITVTSDVPLAHAQNRGVTIESLREQFGRLGNTPYELVNLTADIVGTP